MFDPKNAQFATNQIHGAHFDVRGVNPVSMPIYQTATFVFDSTEHGAACFRGEDDAFFYSRLHNPTSEECGARIALLEGGEAGLVLASGMGAITSVLWTVLKSGDHLVADRTLYGCTYALFTEGLPRMGIEVTFAELNDPAQLKAALRPNTKVVYFETATNPDMKVLDIPEISRITHEYNSDIKVMVDNTFTSPYIVQPIKQGADIVIHSVTKYINGHGDVIAGAIVTKKALIDEIRVVGLKYMTGACIGPQDAFLITRGMKTMDIRMEKHCANAMKVARFLESHPAVKTVRYPGLESHPTHAIAKKMYREGCYGGVVSFELHCGRARTAQMCNNLKLLTLAVSLGDANTLIEHPASMTHSTYTIEALAEIGISESLMRMSVGLENADDIIADLKTELDKIEL